MAKTLNKSQEEGYAKILQFVLGSGKYFILSGAPGYGKSFLIKYIHENLIPQYKRAATALGRKDNLYQNILVTATSHSAVQSLSAEGVEAVTIHSALSIIPRGNKYIQTTLRNYPQSIVIIDEFTFIDSEVFKYIDNSTTKVILVGDKDQLLAVRGLAQALRNKPADHILTEPMRTKDKDILHVTEVFKNWVHRNYEGLEIKGMQSVGWLSQSDFIELLSTRPEAIIGNGNDTKILSYTNDYVKEYNSTIRTALGLTDIFNIGEVVINNKYLHVTPNIRIKTDQLMTICGFTKYSNYVEYHVMLEGHSYPSFYLKVKDRYYQPNKFDDNKYADLRSTYASTIHKAQGRTYENVVLNLSSFPPNTSLSTLSRALYVASSRAKKSFLFVGELHKTLLGKL